MRLSDAGMRCRPTKLIYPDHPPTPWFSENTTPGSLQPIVGSPALGGPLDGPTCRSFTPAIFKYDRKNAPCKISVKRSTRCQVHRRNDNVHVSQEDHYWEKM